MAVIVFSHTSLESFQEVERYVDTINEQCDADCIKILVGNKSDLAAEEQVSTQDGKEKAEMIGIPYFQTTAREMAGLTILFNHILKATINRVRQETDRVTFTIRK